MPGSFLPAIARASISQRLGLAGAEPPCPDALLETGATFVTLTLEGRLRGCIGSLEARRPIAEDTRQNAAAAAFGDPRFPTLDRSGLGRVKIEVSLLSSPENLRFTDEAAAIAMLRPGLDGLVFRCGARRSTFLPQVWEDLPDPEEFLARLKLKAGFPAGFWSGEVGLARYTVSKWKES